MKSITWKQREKKGENLRERERDKERERERQRKKERQRERKREIEKKKKRETERDRKREREKETERENSDRLLFITQNLTTFYILFLISFVFISIFVSLDWQYTFGIYDQYVPLFQHSYHSWTRSTVRVVQYRRTENKNINEDYLIKIK